MVEEGLYGFQIGVVNVERGNFSGVELGGINISSQSKNQEDTNNPSIFRGLQLGIANFNTTSLLGVQLGYININTNSIKGVELGFLSLNFDDVIGLQFGFSVNVAKNIVGAQVGGINITYDTLQGIQLGIYNFTQVLNKGYQVGFVNVVDTIVSGVPFGFFTHVNEGGYRAIEVSTNSLFPLNFSYKTGISKLYNSIGLSFFPNGHYYNNWAFHWGLGTLIPLKNNLYLNIEGLGYLGFDYYGGTTGVSLNCNLAYSFSPHFQIALGLNFMSSADGIQQPFLPIISSYNGNRMYAMGANFALRYSFTKLE